MADNSLPDDNSLSDKEPYSDLGPDRILDAVDACGYQTSGSLLALNSYENRVYQIGLESSAQGDDFIIAKFYRPGRWTDDCILEEHEFSLELAAAEIPIIAPLANAQQQTLLHYKGYRFALFPRRGGRPPELEDADHLRQLGRFLGRIHALGNSRRFAHRPRLSTQRFGREALDYLLQNNFIPAEILHNYQLAAEDMLSQIENTWEALIPLRELRLHGDCHPGNILWTDKGPHFVDLDDCLSGPAIQDLWMLLSGDRDQMSQQMQAIMEGYHTFFDFDPTELQLIEPLRGLRMLHYSAWLARRWNDPAFPHAFPWFNGPRYWEEQLYSLREQAERLNMPVIELY